MAAFGGISGCFAVAADQPRNCFVEYSEQRLEIGKAHEIRIAGLENCMSMRPTVKLHEIGGRLFLDVENIHNYRLEAKHAEEYWHKTPTELTDSFNAGWPAAIPQERHGRYEIAGRARHLHVLLLGAGILEVIANPRTSPAAAQLNFRLVRGVK
jgi:hypothetical protein